MGGGWKVRERVFQVLCLRTQGNEQMERESFMMQKGEGGF